MIDLRIIDDFRKAVIASSIKPTDSKEQNFHLALAEYLYKELKSRKLSVTRHDVILKVALKNKHDNYEHVLIDCMDGKMYLRGKQLKDKYFGRLRRFEGGQRASDAYHCAMQSITRIVNRIKELENSLNEIKEVFGEIERTDMRQKSIVKDLRSKLSIAMDLRKKKILIADLRKQKQIDMRKSKLATNIDVDDRDAAIVYIDGAVYESDRGISHYQLLESIIDHDVNWLNEHPNWFKQHDIAFAGMLKDEKKIYVYKFSYNVSQKYAAEAIKKQYPDFDVCDYNSEIKIAIKDLRRNIVADLRQRVVTDLRSKVVISDLRRNIVADLRTKIVISDLRTKTSIVDLRKKKV
jgi:uncharacterized protein YpmB